MNVSTSTQAADIVERLPECSHCGFPILGNHFGLRHYGTHTAHQESDCLRLLHGEIARLRAALSERAEAVPAQVVPMMTNAEAAAAISINSAIHRLERGDITGALHPLRRIRDVLAALTAQPAAAGGRVGQEFKWPEPPPRRDQSPVLFEDGYEEGWAKCIATLKAMRAASPLPAGEAPTSAWRPIETAPRDGSVFLAYQRGRVRECEVLVRDDGEIWRFGGQSAHADTFPAIVPTHWQPLPEAPTSTPEGQT